MPGMLGIVVIIYYFKCFKSFEKGYFLIGVLCFKDDLLTGLVLSLLLLLV